MIHFSSKSEITRLPGLSILSQRGGMHWQPTWAADHRMKSTIFTLIVQPKTNNFILCYWSGFILDTCAISTVIFEIYKIAVKIFMGS